jgi:hypothetical protein
MSDVALSNCRKEHKFILKSKQKIKGHKCNGKRKPHSTYFCHLTNVKKTVVDIQSFNTITSRQFGASLPAPTSHSAV